MARSCRLPCLKIEGNNLLLSRPTWDWFLQGVEANLRLVSAYDRSDGDLKVTEGIIRTT